MVRWKGDCQCERGCNRRVGPLIETGLMMSEVRALCPISPNRSLSCPYHKYYVHKNQRLPMLRDAARWV